ncbi:MAG: hypothetical protein CM1200mP16_03600 [Nitrospina sp.]|nr:MAG: hypothetical protein CM1200mP16_03600 [Nitrospina sp.]
MLKIIFYTVVAHRDPSQSSKKLAEKFGVQEVNFTFDKHKIFLTRGVRVLTNR